jgi:hypothetical protein
MDSYKFLLLCGLGAEKSWEGYRGGFAGGFADFGVFCGGKSWCCYGGCVVNRGDLHGVIRGLKTCHLFQIYF